MGLSSPMKAASVFAHISAVERSGMRGLAEGMKVSYEFEADRKSGKESATNLKVA
jgi:cold shock protein